MCCCVPGSSLILTPHHSLPSYSRHLVSCQALASAPPPTAAVPQPLPMASQSAAAPVAAAAMAAPHGAAAWRDSPPGETQQRLAAELDAKGVTPYSFLRVVGDYYDHSLEWRRECLGAPSVFRESPLPVSCSNTKPRVQLQGLLSAAVLPYTAPMCLVDQQMLELMCA